MTMTKSDKKMIAVDAIVQILLLAVVAFAFAAGNFLGATVGVITLVINLVWITIKGAQTND